MITNPIILSADEAEVLLLALGAPLNEIGARDAYERLAACKLSEHGVSALEIAQAMRDELRRRRDAD